MNERRIDFIKGHMGGDEVVLLYGDQMPEGREYEVAESVLRRPSIGGHNSGLMWKSDAERISLKMLDGTAGTYIGMCGGLTQVLGKAIVETDLAGRLGLTLTEPRTDLILETDVGPVGLDIRHRNGRMDRVYTDMTAFVEDCYALGIEAIRVAEINALRIGSFLVVNADAAKSAHPEATFEKMEDRELRILQQAQREYNEHVGKNQANFSLYDLHSLSHSGRVAFPHGLETRYYEPSCGTGTVAVGIAMVEAGELGRDGSVTLLLETGGDIHCIGGPDVMELELDVHGGRVVRARISHSLVEILATGCLWI